MIDLNRQDSDDKMKNITEYLTGMIASMMDHIKSSKPSSEKKDQPKAQYPTTMLPDNKKDQPLDSELYKNGRM